MVTSSPVSVRVKRPSRVKAGPDGVSIWNQASPLTAKSNAAPVRVSEPLLVLRNSSPLLT
ncbi:hypothetical protein D3C87_1660650 [compost metagenome]